MALALSPSCFDPHWVLLGLRFPSIEEQFGTNLQVLMFMPVAGQGSKTYTASNSHSSCPQGPEPYSIFWLPLIPGV